MALDTHRSTSATRLTDELARGAGEAAVGGRSRARRRPRTGAAGAPRRRRGRRRAATRPSSTADVSKPSELAAVERFDGAGAARWPTTGRHRCCGSSPWSASSGPGGPASPLGLDEASPLARPDDLAAARRSRSRSTRPAKKPGADIDLEWDRGEATVDAGRRWSGARRGRSSIVAAVAKTARATTIDRLGRRRRGRHRRSTHVDDDEPRRSRSTVPVEADRRRPRARPGPPPDSEVDHRAGERAGDAADHLHPAHDHLARARRRCWPRPGR